MGVGFALSLGAHLPALPYFILPPAAFIPLPAAHDLMFLMCVCPSIFLQLPEDVPYFISCSPCDAGLSPPETFLPLFFALSVHEAHAHRKFVLKPLIFFHPAAQNLHNGMA
jgi:hypothetical protein